MANIMIIDDDVELSANLGLMLEKENHVIKTLDQTDGAIEILQEEIPDLLILDVMFPENPAEGFDFARKVKQNKDLRKLPIIFLTGINQEFPMDFSSGDIDPEWFPVQDFIEKPPDMKILLEKIDKLLNLE